MNSLGLMIRRACDDERLRKLFEHFSQEEMRIMWDGIGDDSFFGPYDCADIHAWMNLRGDGVYCAV